MLLRRMRLIDGAYLLRANLDGLDSELLWRQSVQWTEVEEAFRVPLSKLRHRPIWHRVDWRVKAQIMIAFLGYCLWVCLKQRLRGIAGSLTPARVTENLSKIMMVEVWFDLRQGGRICLPRITEPETEQAAILHRIGWELPKPPPPKIHPNAIPPSQWRADMCGRDAPHLRNRFHANEGLPRSCEAPADPRGDGMKRRRTGMRGDGPPPRGRR